MKGTREHIAAEIGDLILDPDQRFLTVHLLIDFANSALRGIEVYFHLGKAIVLKLPEHLPTLELNLTEVF